MGSKRKKTGRKQARIRGGRQYPRKLELCSSRIALKCKKWYNPYTAKKDGMCNRCYQSDKKY